MSVATTISSIGTQRVPIKQLSAEFLCHPRTIIRRCQEMDIKVFWLNRKHPTIALADAERLAEL